MQSIGIPTQNWKKLFDINLLLIAKTTRKLFTFINEIGCMYSFNLILIKVRLIVYDC